MEVQGRVPGAGDEEMRFRRVDERGSWRSVRGKDILIAASEVDSGEL